MEGNNAGSFKRGNESDHTYRLKWAAWEWLYTEARCRAIGFEVKLEGPNGRVIDVVGVGPENTIYVVEVKVHRGDMFRDDHGLKDRDRLAAKAPKVEARTRLTGDILEQAARYGQEVDPDSWQESDTYRRAVAEHQRLNDQERAYKSRLETFSIKFRDPRFLAIAEYHYLMAARGVLRRREVPPQWGLLDDVPSVVAPAPRKVVRKTQGIISNVLRAIARANTTSMMRHHGVTYGGTGATFPQR